MAIESAPVIEREDLEGIVERAICLDPEKKHNKNSKDDRHYFVGLMDDYSDLRDYYSALRQDNGNVGAIKDIAHLLFPKNPEIIEKRDVTGILSLVDTKLSRAEFVLAKYAENNSFHEELDEMQLHSILVELGDPDNTFLYKIKDNKKHNRLVDLVVLYSALRKGKKEFLNKQVQELMSSAELKNEQKDLYNKYQSDPAYNADLLSSYAGIINRIFMREFGREVMAKDGRKGIELDRSKLYNFFERSLDAAKDAIDDEPDEGKKAEIWDKDLKNIYKIAGELYYREQKAEKSKDDWDKKDDREQERRKMGLRK